MVQDQSSFPLRETWNLKQFPRLGAGRLPGAGSRSSTDSGLGPSSPWDSKGGKLMMD